MLEKIWDDEDPVAAQVAKLKKLAEEKIAEANAKIADKDDGAQPSDHA